MSMDNTATFRTDLYSDAWDGTVCPTLVTHKESIAIINAAGRKFTPELKDYVQGSMSLTYDQVRQKVQAAGAREPRPCHGNCFSQLHLDLACARVP
jgi:hypothetical protein